MNNIGVIPIKANSNRFKNKNLYIYNGKPLFSHSLDILYNSKKIKKIYIPTDSNKVISFINSNYENKRFDDKIRFRCSIGADGLVNIRSLMGISNYEDYGLIIKTNLGKAFSSLIIRKELQIIFLLK